MLAAAPAKPVPSRSIVVGSGFVSFKEKHQSDSLSEKW
jgi:hypothetical protein